MYHIEYDQQLPNDCTIVRLMNGEKTIKHVQLELKASNEQLESTAEELFRTQKQEDLEREANKAAEQARIEAEMAELDAILDTCNDSLDIDGTIVLVKKEKKVKVKDEPIEAIAGVKEEKVK